MRLIDRTTGRIQLTMDAGVPLADAAAIGDSGVLTLPVDGAVARVHYADALDHPVDIKLGLPFNRVSVSKDGHFALAWSPGSDTFVMIDLAQGQVVQPATFRDATVTEARIYNGTAYVLSHDGGFVGVIDLATVGFGRSAEITEVRLGVKGDRPLGDTALLVPMAPSPQMLAVDPVTQTGFVIEAMSGVNGMPPMDATRLRGGIPQKVFVVDRSLTETTPGKFSVSWAFPAGDYELMLTTGVTGLSECLKFAVQGTRQALGVLPMWMEASTGAQPIRAGEPHDIRLTFHGPDGAIVPMPNTRILVPSFRSAWHTNVMAVAQADGALSMRVTLPHPGTFALQPMNLPKHLGLRASAVIDVRPEGE